MAPPSVGSLSCSWANAQGRQQWEVLEWWWPLETFVSFGQTGVTYLLLNCLVNPLAFSFRHPQRHSRNHVEAQTVIYYFQKLLCYPDWDIHCCVCIVLSFHESLHLYKIVPLSQPSHLQNNNAVGILWSLSVWGTDWTSKWFQFGVHAARTWHESITSAPHWTWQSYYVRYDMIRITY